MKEGSTAQNVDKRHVGRQRMCRDQRIAEASPRQVPTYIKRCCPRRAAEKTPHTRYM